MTEINIADIIIGERRRKDMGDIQSLATSIQAIGLLHPPVVTPDNRLVVGERRIKAYQLLERKKIPILVANDFDDAVKLVMAERDENTCRKDFLPSEGIAITKALDEFEKNEAKKRQKEGPKKTSKHSDKSPSSENFTELGKSTNTKKGQSRDKVAKTIGVSGITYSRTKEIVEAAEADPELQSLVDEMDKKGKVNGTAVR